MLQVQKHINLSLRLIKNASALPNIRQIKEAKFDQNARSRIVPNNNLDSEVVGIDQNQEFNRVLPRRHNRAEINLEAARVSFTSNVLSTLALFGNLVN